MTQITTGELKIILFALFFSAITIGFGAIYNESPIQVSNIQTPDSNINSNSICDSITNTSTNIEISNCLKSTIDSSGSLNPALWITKIISPLTAPFDDPQTLFLAGLIIAPISYLLLPIAVRFTKDLLSQWV